MSPLFRANSASTTEPQPLPEADRFIQKYWESLEDRNPSSTAALIHVLVDYHCGDNAPDQTIFELIYGKDQGADNRKNGQEIHRFDQFVFQSPDVLRLVLERYEKKHRGASNSSEFEIWRRYLDLSAILSNSKWEYVTWEQIDSRISAMVKALDEFQTTHSHLADRSRKQALLLASTYGVIQHVYTMNSDYTPTTNLWVNPELTLGQDGWPDFKSKDEYYRLVRLEHLITTLKGFREILYKESWQQVLEANSDLPSLESKLIMSVRKLCS